ncbi:MAG: hypothetical protein L6Q66_10865 [Bacteroidia bacterium]|nr:hypothetical protein [Bacteroidia bacterium]
MKYLKVVLVILIVLSFPLGYSYFNYSKRSKSLDFINSEIREKGLIKISFFKEFHFNIFDWILEDKSDNFIIALDPHSIRRDDGDSYSVRFVRYDDPRDINTFTNYTLERTKVKYYYMISDFMWDPIKQDSFLLNEINGSLFQCIDIWMKKNK